LLGHGEGEAVSRRVTAKVTRLAIASHTPSARLALPQGVPVAGVQETTILGANDHAVEQNDGLCPHIAWMKCPDICALSATFCPCHGFSSTPTMTCFARTRRVQSSL